MMGGEVYCPDSRLCYSKGNHFLTFHNGVRYPGFGYNYNTEGFDVTDYAEERENMRGVLVDGPSNRYDSQYLQGYARAILERTPAVTGLSTPELPRNLQSWPKYREGHLIPFAVCSTNKKRGVGIAFGYDTYGFAICYKREYQINALNQRPGNRTEFRASFGLERDLLGFILLSDGGFNRIRSHLGDTQIEPETISLHIVEDYLEKILQAHDNPLSSFYENVEPIFRDREELTDDVSALIMHL